MIDALSQVISQLRPQAVLARTISGAGRWGVRYTEFGNPSFCIVTEGSCRLIVDGEAPITLQAGDFVLLPATPGFVLSGFEPVIPVRLDPHAAAVAPHGELRHGSPDADPDVRMIGGYFEFGSPDAGLLVSLLPRLVHLRGIERLSTLVHLVSEEVERDSPGRDLILFRLVEVLLVEALRSFPQQAPPGLLKGLADERVAGAIRAMHGDVARAWTVPQLAREAGLSRSAFFDRFLRKMGTPPMEYLLAWRMALAKDLLCREALPIETVAARLGYGSASTFSTAFRRSVGQSPGRYARRPPVPSA
ncbi:AraC family transcriptional regulator [Mycolicibacterium aubagnense]